MLLSAKFLEASGDVARGRSNNNEGDTITNGHLEKQAP